MIGPITSEIAKVNRRKIAQAFSKKVEEIQTLYIKPGIQVPKKIILENPKEVVEAFEVLKKPTPPLALQALKFLQKIELFGGILLILLLSIITFTIIELWKPLPFLAIPFIIITPIILFSILYNYTHKKIWKIFTKKFS